MTVYDETREDLATAIGSLYKTVCCYSSKILIMNTGWFGWC